MKTVIEMAREAGITFKLMIVEGLEYDYREVNLNDNIGGDEFGCIERLVELARADEREEIKQVVEKELLNTSALMSMPHKSSAAWNILMAIRARRTHDV